MTELVWKRRGRGLGIYADTATHRYSIYSLTSRNWVAVPLHDPRTSALVIAPY